ncbi:ABC transporter permease [Corynebacterium hadale]|uniref:ABC transporter permease n=1 Tax=Corynebacterium hadale TaxID=2026255 RepID=UPI001055839C|nr:ABC transporter permease [Corynebacterium hadale]
MSTIVASDQLRSVSGRPPLKQYVADIKQRQRFIWLDARARAFKTDREMVLGSIWLVLSPLIDTLMYAAIFGLILKTSRGIENFIGYLVIGVVFFGMIRGPLVNGIGLMKPSRKLIGAFDLPAATVVISRSLRESLDSIVPGLVAIVVALCLQIGTPISPTIIFIVPVWFLIQIHGLGLIFLSARLTAEIPDLRVAIKIFVRAWFFVSGVFFSIERFVNNPTVATIMYYNPAYQFLKAARDVTIYADLPSLTTWMALTSWSIFLCLLGFIFFWRGEGRYARVR